MKKCYACEKNGDVSYIPANYMRWVKSFPFSSDAGEHNDTERRATQKGRKIHETSKIEIFGGKNNSEVRKTHEKLRLGFLVEMEVNMVFVGCGHLESVSTELPSWWWGWEG